MNHPHTISIYAAADLVDISADAIRAAVKRGEYIGFPVLKAGRAYRVPRLPLLRVLGIEEQ